MSRQPTIKQRRLAAELLRCRELAGVYADEVAEALGWSPSKISRIENCRVIPKRSDVERLAEYYGLDSERTKHLLMLATNLKQKGWWEPYQMPDPYTSYIQMEAESEEIRIYSQGLVPGLLQTSDYARAVIISGTLNAIPPEEVSRRVEVRMRRQDILTREGSPLALWVVIDEGVLHRLVGGPAAMRAQLDRLIEYNELPNVNIQVLPSRVGAHPSLIGSYSLLRFADGMDWSVVTIETVGGMLWVEDAATVHRYTQSFDHLRAQALGQPPSSALMEKIKREL